MNSDFLLVARLLFTALFVTTLLVGAYLLRHHERFFGADAAMPSENGSARAYSKVQVWTLWAHAALLFGTFAAFSY